MSAPALSIIVPVYDVEDYLSLCLDSIVNQSFEDYELILVDDGSTDHSGKICDEYAQKDKRIVVLHKKNGGLSSARNKGLDIASGRYITFVDSDDRIAPDTYSKNMELLAQYPEVDILQFPTNWGKGTGDIQILKQRFLSGEEEVFSNWWEGDVLNASVWNKIFCREMFSIIRFPEGHFFEDMFLLVDFSEKARQVLISKYGCYYYFIRDNSISNVSKYSFEKNMDMFFAQFKVYRKLYSFDHLRPYRLIAFLRVYRKLIMAQQTDRTANLKPYFDELKKYVPGWKDLFITKSRMKEVIWTFFIKIVGLSFFMFLYIKYLDLKSFAKNSI